MKYLRLLILTLTLLLLTNVSLVMAQGAITDGNVQFVLGSTPFDSSPGADLTGVSAPLNRDQLFESGWWFRVSGDTQETFFPVPTTQNYVANTATLGWASLAGGLFSAQLQWMVTDDDGLNGPLPSGSLQGVMTITNLSADNSLTLNLFNMTDFDLKPSAQSDRAVAGPTGMRIFSSGDNAKARARYIGVGADTYLVRPDGATDVGTVLSDTGVTNFDNSGLPFGPGNFSGGWQWKDRVIPPSGTLTVSAIMTVNGPVDLKLTKTASGSTAANGAILYKLEVSNVGMSAATGVTLTETVPANTTFNPGASSAGWACAPDNNAGSTCTLSVGVVDLVTSANFDYAVTVIASPTSSTITNTASVADDGANGTDSNQG